MMAQVTRKKQASSVALQLFPFNMINSLQSKEKLFHSSVALNGEHRLASKSDLPAK